MKIKSTKFLALTVITSLMALFLPSASPVHAAGLTSMSATLSTLTISALANQEILFTTPTGLAADETIILITKMV